MTRIATWDGIFSDRVREADECLEWAGTRHPGGYGRVSVSGRAQYAHRASYALANAVPWEDMPEVVRHTCDNPICVRPSHLVGGTTAENVADRVAKGRSAGHIDDALVEKVRRLVAEDGRWGAQRRVARTLGISEGYVSSLVRGEYRGRGIGGYSERKSTAAPRPPLPEAQMRDLERECGGVWRVPYGRSAELAGRYGVSPRTLRRAVDWLRDERGRGRSTPPHCQ